MEYNPQFLFNESEVVKAVDVVSDLEQQLKKWCELYVNYNLDNSTVSEYVRKYKNQYSSDTKTDKWFDGVKILGFNYNKNLKVIAWKNTTVYTHELVELDNSDNSDNERSPFMFSYEYSDNTKYNEVFKGDNALAIIFSVQLLDLQDLNLSEKRMKDQKEVRDIEKKKQNLRKTISQLEDQIKNQKSKLNDYLEKSKLQLESLEKEIIS